MCVSCLWMTGTGEQVRAWVRREGLNETTFKEQDIDGSALHELWMQRSEPHGVAEPLHRLLDREGTTLGSRLRFFHRLREFSRRASAPLPPPSPARPPPSPSRPPPPLPLERLHENVYDNDAASRIVSNMASNAMNVNTEG